MSTVKGSAVPRTGRRRVAATASAMAHEPRRRAPVVGSGQEIRGDSERLYRALAENLPGAIVFLLDADLRIIAAAGDGLRAVSWFDGVFVGKNVADLVGLVPQGALDQSLDNYRAALSGDRREFEFTSEGRSIFVQAVPIRDGSAEVSNILVVVRDITEQRRAETGLRTSELLYHTLAANIPDTAVGILDRDLHWVILEGVGVLAHLGMTKEALEGQALGSSDLGMADAMRPSFLLAFRGQSSRREWHTPHGRRFEIYIHPVRDDAAQIYAAMVWVTDVSERDSAYAAMRRLSAIVESSGDAIVAVDLTGAITSWNAAAELLFGYAADEAIGQHFALLAKPNTGVEQIDVLRLIPADGPIEGGEQILRHKDGSPVPVSLTMSPIYDQKGSLIGVSGAARDISQTRRIQARAEVDRKRLAAAQAQAHVGSVEWNPITNETWWSIEFRRIIGLADTVEPSEQLLEASVYPPDLGRLQPARNAMLAEGPGVNEVYRVLRPSGEIRWVRESASATRDSAGVVTLVTATVLDITDLHEAQEQRGRAETRFRLAFEKSPIGKLMADLEGRLTDVNPAICDILGRTPAQLITHSWNEFAPWSQVHHGRPYQQMLTGELETFDTEYQVQRPDGALVWIQESTSLVRDADGTPRHFLGQLQDVTDRKRGEEKLAYQASHDPLTGLPNREVLRHRVEQATSQAEADGSTTGLLLLDLDGFKDINDSLGHAAGDAVLAVVAQRLTAVVGSADTVARLGGDEFAVCLPGPIGPTEAVAVTRRILAVLREPVSILGLQVPVAASIGVALAPEHGRDASTLLRHADVAMYRAKSSRSGWALFDRSLDAARTERLQLIADLGRGIRHDQLELHYQPIVEMATGDVVSVEALVRWRHPTRGLLSPAAFVTLAEQSGLIGALTDWVVDAAVAQTRRWKANSTPLRCAINLSVGALTQASGSEALIRSIVEHRALLSVEITESVLADQRAMDAFMQLALGGVSCAIDDFGTGYSSLSSLKDLPVKKVKIDRSFVLNLERDERDFAIVSAVVALADALSLAVIAEGVETVEAATRLQQAGVNFAQGYLYARPMPAAELQRWLVARRKVRCPESA